MKAWTTGIRNRPVNQALALTNQPPLRWRLAVYGGAVLVGAAVGVALAVSVWGWR